MKFFRGNKLAGGSASRAEVYGLFIAAVVLVGGGVGGAFAYSASGGFNQAKQSEVSPTNSASATSGQTNNSSAQSGESSTGNSSENYDSRSSGGSKKNQQDAPVATEPEVGPAQPEPPVDTRIQEPYIGPANTFSYLSRNHICGWDTEALGGFGWGYDPAEPCNRQFEAYIRDNCGTKDPTTGQWSGIVYFQRCDEMASGTLPIAY